MLPWHPDIKQWTHVIEQIGQFSCCQNQVLSWLCAAFIQVVHSKATNWLIVYWKSNIQKMVLYHRKFQEHCFIIMDTIIYCLLCVRNYCECSHGFSHFILLANSFHYPHLAGKKHLDYTEPHSWEGSEPGLESSPFNYTLCHYIPLSLCLCLTLAWVAWGEGPQVFHLCSLSTGHIIQV